MERGRKTREGGGEKQSKSLISRGSILDDLLEKKGDYSQSRSHIKFLCKFIFVFVIMA